MKKLTISSGVGAIALGVAGLLASFGSGAAVAGPAHLATGNPVTDFYGVKTANQTTPNMSVVVNGQNVPVPANGTANTTVPTNGNGASGNVHVSVSHSESGDGTTVTSDSSSSVSVSTNSSSSTSVNVNSNVVNNNSNQNAGFFSNTVTQNGQVISNVQNSF